MQEPDLSLISYVARDYVDKPKAVIVNFPGLGDCSMRSSLDTMEVEWAAKGVLFVFPSVNPWSWMNERTVKFVDYVLDRVEQKYSTRNLPLIARGGSMGGYSALAYTMFSRKPVAGCMAVAPVCDLFYHYSERPDLPRTLHDAFDDYSDISAVLKSRSPVHQADQMPDANYMIVHGCKDVRVSKEAHSDAMVKLMKQRKLRVTYVEDSKMEHGWPLEYKSVVTMNEFVNGFVD